MAHNAPFAPLNTAQLNGHLLPKAAAQWAVVMPVPPDAPPPADKHPRLGQPSMRWTYRNANGECLGYIWRFDLEDEKQFRPLVLYRSTSTNAIGWRWEAWPTPRPLYGLDRLAANLNAIVLVCEGERAADAAQRLCPDHVVMTSPNGSKSPAKADWTPLHCCRVIIWPDADEPGEAYAKTVAKLLKDIGAASIKIVTPPAGVADGWDAGDAEMEGWTQSQASEFLSSAIPFESNEEESEKKESKPKRKPQRDALVSLCGEATLWHGPDYEPYATVAVNGHHENWPIRSAAFKRWLAFQAYSEHGIAPGGQALEDTLRILEARAVNEGALKTPWRRVGSQRGKLYLDLCDSSWQVIEISPSGYKIISGADLPFFRSPRMRALCEPEPGYPIADFWPFVNVSSDDDFVLIVAFIIAALRERGPYPVLVLNGEQGSGKSNLSRRVRSLIDPSSPAIQGPPKDEQTLILAAQNGHLLAFDNLSHVDPLLSDGMARVSTGSGMAVRALHTDKDENIFEGARPIIINGIPHLADRADLNDRAIIVHLESIDDLDRRPEDEIEADWERARPRVLGAICDALSAALRRLKDTKLTRPGRMADFEKWVTAAEAGLGWEAGTFSQAYAANRANAAAATFESDPVAVAIEALIVEDHQRGWSGTATRLLDLIGDKVSESLKRSNAWPRGASGLGNRLERVKPLLRQRGLIVERRHSGTREISILPKSQPEEK